MRVTSALVCHVNIPSLENSVYETLSVKKALRKKGERWIFMDVIIFKSSVLNINWRTPQKIVWDFIFRK